MADEYDQLAAYGAAVRDFRAADAAHAEAMASVQPSADAREAAYEAVKAAVESMEGADPFSVLKQAKAAGTKRGPRGPRDPSRRNAIIEALGSGPKSLGEVVDATGLDRNYVSNALTNLAKSGKVSATGERGSRSYEYVEQEVAEPVPA